MKDLFDLLWDHFKEWVDHLMEGFINFPLWGVIVAISVFLWSILTFQGHLKCNRNKVLDWVDPQ